MREPPHVGCYFLNRLLGKRRLGRMNPPGSCQLLFSPFWAATQSPRLPRRLSALPWVIVPETSLTVPITTDPRLPRIVAARRYPICAKRPDVHGVERFACQASFGCQTSGAPILTGMDRHPSGGGRAARRPGRALSSAGQKIKPPNPGDKKVERFACEQTNWLDNVSHDNDWLV